MEIINRIQFQERNKISVGKFIRKVISYLYNELMRTLTDFMTRQTGKEQKKVILINTIKETHKAIKKLEKFVKNCNKFPKLDHLDKLSAIMYSYGNYIHEVTDKLYFTNNMCKDFRLPGYNLSEANKVITNTSHPDLKSKIADGFNHLKFTEAKEKIFDFFEKFAYNENFYNNDRGSVIDNMRKQIISLLDVNNEILKARSSDRKITFQNDKFVFTFGEMIEYKLMVFIPAGVGVASYYCYEIKIIDERKCYNIQPMRILNFLNEELYKAVQIGLEEFNGLALAEVAGFLSDFNTKYILPELFHIIERFVKDYIDHTLRAPVAITFSPKSDMNIKVINQIETDAFGMEIRMDTQMPEYIFITYSHQLLCDDPVVFAGGITTRIGFNSLNNYNWEKMLSHCFKDFRKIHLDILTERVRAICKNGLMTHQISVDQEMEKVFVQFDAGLLFSIILNNKGGIEVTDDEFLFKSKKDYHSRFNLLMKEMVMTNQGYHNEEINNIIFNSYIESYFNMLSINVGTEIIENNVNLSFCIVDHSLHQVYLYIPIRLRREYSYLDDYNIAIRDGEGNVTNVTNEFNLLNGLTSHPSVREFYELITTRKSFAITKSFLRLIYNFLTILSNTYEDFFRIYIDNYTLAPLSKVTPGTDYIIIDWNENQEVLQRILMAGLIEPDNTDFFYKFFKRISISTKNYIIRLYLNDSFIEEFFSFINLTSHCLFLNDYLIHYDKDNISISIYFLTKINNRSDNTQIKRFFSRILNKLINYLRKTLRVINSKFDVNF
jgi:hypothetical protein